MADEEKSNDVEQLKEDAVIVKEDIPKMAEEAIKDGKEQIEKEKKEEIVLPEIGTKFLVNGVSYKVCYINEGKQRFSAEPCEGQY